MWSSAAGESTMMMTTIQQACMRRCSLAGILSQKVINRSISTVQPNNNRVPTTLYRQILHWCRRYRNVPFSPLPPVTLSPPHQVNSAALKRLKDMRALLLNVDTNNIIDNNKKEWGEIGGHPAHYAMYKEGVVVSDDLITFPEINNANDLQGVIRSIYWLNNQHTIEEVHSAAITDINAVVNEENDTKEQISLAFEAIKSCNQLSFSELDTRRGKREMSMKVRQKNGESDEKGVIFHVGQVVQHKNDKWRGVVVGWDIEKNKNDDGQLLSSLTTKQYSLHSMSDGLSEATTTKSKKKVQYTVLVDYYDNKLLLQSAKTVTLESQDDLVSVTDPW